ncbi:SDR family oxidoreductase [Minwuia sp.]|uniref:SDR family oxidoreductase n=1 Tax=Minwuia sp. TaxID=2493630 RepID=UPI003A8DE4D4
MGYSSIFRDGIFDGRTYIVTGGGTGLGRCAAHEIVALGGTVALVGRTLSKLETTAAEIEAEGGTATCHVADIRDEERVTAMIGEIIDAHARIDGLVNNAGGQFSAKIEDISAKGWDAVVRNNLTGGFLMSREVWKQWMRDHGGAIVNITAEFDLGLPDMAHSGAARAGMDNFTKTAALEWAHAGVRVNAVAPGWVASSGYDNYPPEVSAELATRDRYVPLRRHGVEAEVSAAIVFLLSDAAAYITGQSIGIDGGAPLERGHRPSEPGERHNRAWDGFHLYQSPRALRGRLTDDET